MSKYKGKKKRSGLGTGQACMGLNISNQRDCPFKSCEGADMCSINDLEDCDLDTCKLKEFGRIIVDWVKQ